MAKITAKTTEVKDAEEATAAPSPAAPILIVTVECDDAPNAFALQFLRTFRVVFFVRKGREESDEAELRRQIIDNEGAPLLVPANGGPGAKLFNIPEEPDCYFRILAIAR